MLQSWGHWMVLVTTLAALGALAARGDETAGKLRSVIQAYESGAHISAAERSPVSGLYLTSIDGVSGYVSADGRYFIVGDMLDLASRTDVTEERRKNMRRALLHEVAPAETIVFGPANPKHTVIALRMPIVRTAESSMKSWVSCRRAGSLCVTWPFRGQVRIPSRGARWRLCGVRVIGGRL